MSDFANLLSCDVGGANFTLIEYSYKETPVIKEGFGRIGTRVSIEGSGYISAAGFQALADAVQAADGSFHTSGQSITIRGVGGVVEQQLAAAACVDGGPHIDFSLATGDIGMQRDVKFTATGSTAPDGPINTYTTKVATRPDGLIVVTQSGEIYGPDTQSYFLSTTLPAFQKQYAAPDWVVKFDNGVTSDIYLTRTAYNMEATQTADPLPFFNGIQSVQGTASQSTQRDAQDRLTTTFNFSLQLGKDDDPDAFVAGLRAYVIGNCPQTSDGTAQIYSESVQQNTIAENRVDCSFTILTGANDDDLISWQQSFEGQTESPPLVGLEYSGISPVIVLGKLPVYRYTQRGTAVAVGRYAKPADPIYNSGMEGLPKIGLSPLDQFLNQTTWEYTFIFTNAEPISLTPPLAAFARPANPSFFGAAPAGGGA